MRSVEGGYSSRRECKGLRGGVALGNSPDVAVEPMGEHATTASPRY
jgi:hypothetical protein